MPHGKTNKDRLDELARRLNRRAPIDFAPDPDRDRSLRGKTRRMARKAKQRAEKGSVLRRG